MSQIPEASGTAQPVMPDTQTQAAEGSATETIPGPEELLRKAELAALEHHDAWLRAKAEADNIRKRAQAEIASAHRFALEGFAGELLAVKDSLEAALVADNATAGNMRSGVELTLKLLAGVFERFSIVEINPVGQKFDPRRHQAISTEESDTEPNTVVRVLQKGYLLHERVIRPALVTVTKSKPVES